MAAASSAECSLCYELYSSEGSLHVPKVLNCGHTFCIRCIESWKKRNVSFTCPKCQRQMDIPQNDPNLLITNFDLYDSKTSPVDGGDVQPGSNNQPDGPVQGESPPPNPADFDDTDPKRTALSPLKGPRTLNWRVGPVASDSDAVDAEEDVAGQHDEAAPEEDEAEDLYSSPDDSNSDPRTPSPNDGQEKAIQQPDPVDLLCLKLEELNKSIHVSRTCSIGIANQTGSDLIDMSLYMFSGQAKIPPPMMVKAHTTAIMRFDKSFIAARGACGVFVYKFEKYHHYLAVMFNVPYDRVILAYQNRCNVQVLSGGNGTLANEVLFNSLLCNNPYEPNEGQIDECTLKDYLQPPYLVSFGMSASTNSIMHINILKVDED